MWLEGKIYKSGRYWMIASAALDLTTQGKTENDAYLMFKEAAELLIDAPGFEISFRRTGTRRFAFSANRQELLIALLLKRQRQKAGLTLKEVARRLGASSINAIARYEQGKACPSVAKLNDLIMAINPKMTPVLHLAA